MTETGTTSEVRKRYWRQAWISVVSAPIAWMAVFVIVPLVKPVLPWQAAVMGGILGVCGLAGLVWSLWAGWEACDASVSAKELDSWEKGRLFLLGISGVVISVLGFVALIGLGLCVVVLSPLTGFQTP